MKRLGVKGRRLVLGLLGLALLAALLFGALRAGPLAPVRVTVARAEPARLAPALFGIGTVEARRSVLIGPTGAGRVQSVAVDVGERVRAGQLLAEMDPVDLEARVAALDAASARAASALQAAQAQLDDARARQALTAANWRRHAELAAQNFISPGALEARQQELASAQAAVGAAQANLAAARLDQQRLAAERAAVRQQRAHVQLLAPFDAVVVSREAEPGATVVAGQPVLRLIDPSSLWVKLRLDQGRSAGLAAGLPAQIVLRSDPEHPLPGQVARVEALSDSVTEERVAQVRFERLPATLSVGELAEVTLNLPETGLAPTVPNAAIRRQQGRSGVWQLDAEGLHFRPVRLGASSLEGRVQVLEGLPAGATVVVHSERALEAGSRTRVVAALAGAPL
ncbi:efflux RND transporter periplasmic adaptor subunit [Inhella proteolytica]|uniref:Efflux RND transporter periplasmic adaptor subunit n=1 Tax=Inhella proteolytica TaxID=2795029 RepID=A0A931J889_9BURK|nr:efflux RND transporter periplasmic adaptor subunit [Inhella proteolytica]MBH9578592.1 efflux RND transporter periplasmic adaptor subunit [Inhella proteolytica]